VPYSSSTIFDFFNIQAATMKRFSYNTTRLSPVLKKPHPTTKGQDKTKEGTKQEQPWLVQVSKKSNKKQEKITTNNKNYKQQLMKTYSSTVSSAGPPVSLTKGERKREQELVVETAAATNIIKLSVDDRQRCSTTSTIFNAPARNNMGMDKESQSLTTTVTGSLSQKPVTLAAANLGSCDNNPGEAETTMGTGAIFEKKEAAQRGSIRGATGNIKKIEKLKKIEKYEKLSSSQGAFISDKISDDPHPTGAMDGNPGGSKVS
jgi:hypothetical protein